MTQWSKAASVLILANCFQDNKEITDSMKCYTWEDTMPFNIHNCDWKHYWNCLTHKQGPTNWKTMRILDLKKKKTLTEKYTAHKNYDMLANEGSIPYNQCTYLT